MSLRADLMAAVEISRRGERVASTANLNAAIQALDECDGKAMRSALEALVPESIDRCEGSGVIEEWCPRCDGSGEIDTPCPGCAGCRPLDN